MDHRPAISVLCACLLCACIREGHRQAAFVVSDALAREDAMALTSADIQPSDAAGVFVADVDPACGPCRRVLALRGSVSSATLPYDVFVVNASNGLEFAETVSVTMGNIPKRVMIWSGKQGAAFRAQIVFASLKTGSTTVVPLDLGSVSGYRAMQRNWAERHAAVWSNYNGSGRSTGVTERTDSLSE